MSGMMGEDDEQPANRSARFLLVLLLPFLRERKAYKVK